MVICGSPNGENDLHQQDCSKISQNVDVHRIVTALQLSRLDVFFKSLNIPFYSGRFNRSEDGQIIFR